MPETSSDSNAIDPPSTRGRTRIAVIGGGHLGRIHAKLLAGRDDVTFVAVCDPAAASRHEVESKLNLPTRDAWDGLEGEVDGVVIATPTTLHHRIARWCLERGIHTLIEKPIASTSQEADDLVRMADRQNCRLQVGHVERFNPVWGPVHAAIDLSAIRHIDARREGVYTGRSTDIGIVLDLMIHDIDLILSLVRSPLESIRANGRRVLGEHEDFAIADLVFQNGTTAHLRASRISPTAVRAMEIHCDDEWFGIDFTTGTVRLTRPTEDVANGTLQADCLPIAERLAVKEELFSRWLQQVDMKPAAGNAMALEHDDFLASIREERSPTVSGHDGLRALDVACEIAEQIADQSQRAIGIIPASRLAEARRRAG
jgi:predicted dehydrogenase